ncbi:MAG: hypothetical protein FWE28_00880 [Oscillospiraceae bacterium]|nr:hypothetical protein [Oscillospiraceae bacterium]
MKQPRVISFPHMADYAVPLELLFGRLFPHAEIRPAPPITKETAVLGARHSPDFICEPFKYNMGNFIEGLEAGADTLFQTGTGCRYGYYGELQEQILTDLGYDFQFICLNRDGVRPRQVYNTLRTLGSPLTLPRMAGAFAVAVESIRAKDKLADYVRRHGGGNGLEDIYNKFLQALLIADSVPKIFTLMRAHLKQMQDTSQTQPAPPLRVGIVGDLYTVMEPFSNYDLERKLAKRGVSISRRMSVTFLLFGPPNRRTLRQAEGYLRYPVGANGLDSVAQSVSYAKQGFDGVIHAKAFGCTPELNAVPALMNLSRDCDMPILHLSFDTHLSPAGFETRLEAFLDMIEMRRQQRHADTCKSRDGHRFHLHQRRGTR